MLQEVKELRGELRALFEARVPLINLVTYEERRVDRAITEAAPEGYGVYAWDIRACVEQLRTSSSSFDSKTIKEEVLFQEIRDSMPKQSIVILHDFQMCWNDRNKLKPIHIRFMRILSPLFRSQNKFLVFVTPQEEVPVELKDEVFVMHVPLPDENDLGRVLDEMCAELPERQKPAHHIRHLMVNSALGLTCNQAYTAFVRVYTRYGRFDEEGVDMVMWEKRRIVRESGALEFTPNTAGEGDVGGLDLLKAYIKRRQCAFTEEARAEELPYPKGIALIGIPGTGKSLSAKLIAALLRLPLLRLDMGSIFGSLLGESESHIRKAINLAELVSPCILWIDEIEKAFAGSSGPYGHGAATRVFGTFLTWMQERTAPVYVIATANDVSMLAPELMGRFDQTFFLDAPNDEERREIFRIKLEQIGKMLRPGLMDLDKLADATHGYVGREIERIVTEARYAAFSDGNREIDTKDLMKVIEEMVPLTKSHAEVLNGIQQWKTNGFAVPASSESPRKRVDVMKFT